MDLASEQPARSILNVQELFPLFRGPLVSSGATDTKRRCDDGMSKMQLNSRTEKVTPLEDAIWRPSREKIWGVHTWRHRNEKASLSCLSLSSTPDHECHLIDRINRMDDAAPADSRSGRKPSDRSEGRTLVENSYAEKDDESRGQGHGSTSTEYDARGRIRRRGLKGRDFDLQLSDLLDQRR